MSKQTVNNTKLGIFVLAALIFLVLLLYMIGKNRNLFGSNYALKARFENVHGLVPGNNVRYAGIQAGTVKKVTILNDTVIEVTMTIETKLQNIIRKNAIASIGTDGLVGNKVLNISPARQTAALAVEGDILYSKKAVDTEEMMETLYKTNNDVAGVASGLKMAVEKLNSSTALWALLNDHSLPDGLKASAANLRLATARAGLMAASLEEVIADIKKGKGSAGMLLRDSSFAHYLQEAAVKIGSAGSEADSLARALNKMVNGIQEDISNGKGTVNSLLKDSLVVKKINASLTSIQNGTEGFNQSMDALKHSFLFRGYFKRLEKQKKKEAAKAIQ
ncbi:MAG: MlaD family protein [Ferruginibacter sp.]